MADSDVKVLSYSEIKNHPIKVTFGLLGVIFVAGVMAKPWAVEQISVDFFTKAEAANHVQAVNKRLDTVESQLVRNSSAINGLSTEVRVSAAFQMKRGIQDDLDKHNTHKPTPTTERWRETQRHLEGRLRLANEYKDCVLKENKNCDLLQRQLWQ